jgi:hypothetical protein
MMTNYQIHLEGHLDHAWSDWLNGSTINHQADGTTLLIHAVPDQAALFGLLIKIRDLGLPLISINQIKLPKVT